MQNLYRSAKKEKYRQLPLSRYENRSDIIFIDKRMTIGPVKFTPGIINARTKGILFRNDQYSGPYRNS